MTSMKICITSYGKTLEDGVDPRFGRCAYFLIVDSETGAAEAVANDSNDAARGAGIASAQRMADIGVEAVITGHVGPNAFNALTAANIHMYIGASSRAAEALERFKKGELEEPKEPSLGPLGMRGGRL